MIYEIAPVKKINEKKYAGLNAILNGYYATLIGVGGAGFGVGISDPSNEYAQMVSGACIGAGVITAIIGACTIDRGRNRLRDTINLQICERRNLLEHISQTTPETVLDEPANQEEDIVKVE